MLQNDAAEVEQLYADILIHVTGFFRDPEVFAVLRETSCRSCSQNRRTQRSDPGLGAGLRDGRRGLLARHRPARGDDGRLQPPIQIFGTDLSDAAVDRARIGVFSGSMLADVSPRAPATFLHTVDGGYRMSKAVRELLRLRAAKRHQDPPFSRLDLISCRNVMIYLGAGAAAEVMSIFHYALRPNGYLLLGSSETIGNFGELFAAVDRKHKIYQKKRRASTARHRVPTDRCRTSGSREVRPATRARRPSECLSRSRPRAAGALLARPAC